MTNLGGTGVSENTDFDDEVTALLARQDRLNPATLAIAIADVSLQVNDKLHVAERTADNDGFFLATVVLKSTITINGVWKIASTGDLTLAIVIDEAEVGQFSASALGVKSDGTNQTTALQSVIDAYDNADIDVNLFLDNNTKFSLNLLTHTGQLTLNYLFDDDLSFPNVSTGAAGQRIEKYMDHGVANIADNDVDYKVAVYHPANILENRPDALANSPHATDDQKRNSITSYIQRTGGYNRNQIAYREGIDPVTNDLALMSHGGLDFTFHAITFSFLGVTSSSFSSPPAIGDFVKTSSGAVCVVENITGSLIVFNQHYLTPQNGDTVTTLTETTTDTLSNRSQSVSQKINRFGYSSKNGGNMLVNMQPDRAVKNLSVGGVIAAEKGQGSVFGTSDPELQLMDDLETPTLGFRLRYNPSTNAIEFIKAGTTTIVFSIDQSTLVTAVSTLRASSSVGAPEFFVDSTIVGASPKIVFTTGDPNGNITAGNGSLALDKNGGFWSKSGGTSDTDWTFNA